MSKISLRESLKNIDEPRPGKKVPSFPHGFQCFPNSLNEAVRAMNSPRIDKWTCVDSRTFENLPWTEECQGLTSDGKTWFITSNNTEYKGIYKFDLDFSTFLGARKVPWAPADHVGDPDYYDGKIYVPVESSSTPRVWILDTELNNMGVFELGISPQGTRMPWRAINPWDECLYTSIFANSDYGFDYGLADRLYVYDPKKGFSFKGEFF